MTDTGVSAKQVGVVARALQRLSADGQALQARLTSLEVCVGCKHLRVRLHLVCHRSCCWWRSNRWGTRTRRAPLMMDHRSSLSGLPVGLPVDLLVGHRCMRMAPSRFALPDD